MGAPVSAAYEREKGSIQLVGPASGASPPMHVNDVIPQLCFEKLTKFWEK